MWYSHQLNCLKINMICHIYFRQICPLFHASPLHHILSRQYWNGGLVPGSNPLSLNFTVFKMLWKITKKWLAGLRVSVTTAGQAYRNSIYTPNSQFFCKICQDLQSLGTIVRLVNLWPARESRCRWESEGAGWGLFSCPIYGTLNIRLMWWSYLHSDWELNEKKH